MTSEIEVDDITAEATAAKTPGSASPDVADPLRSLRLVKWLTRLFVYPGVTALIPLDHFLTGLTWEQAITVHLGGFVIATIAIELAFGQAFKLRKHAAYPNVLVMELGEAQTVDAAARLALPVLNRLLGVRASFIALAGDEAGHSLASAFGMSPRDAERLLEAGASSIREAMRSQQPAPWDPEGAVSGAAGVSRDQRMVFVPLVALQQPVGVLALAGSKGNGNLKDGQLLTNIGSVLGLSLENLRQKEELGESEERFRTVFESAPIGMAILSPEGQFRETDRAFREMLGFTDDELRSMTFTDITHPDDVDKSAKLYGEFVRGKRNQVQIEKRYCAKDGRILWCHTATSAVRNSNGEIQYFVAMIENITERKQAEDALRESEERLHTVVASTPIVMFVLNREGVFTLSEGKGLETLGLKPGEVVGQSVFDVYRDHPQILEDIRRGLAGESFATIMDVGDLAFETLCAPIRDHNGEVVGLTGVATDITERKRAEEELRKSEAKFRTLAETSAAATFIDQGMRFRYVNSMTETITGYSREELLAMDVMDVVHPDFRDMVRERGAARQRGEQVPPRYEIKILTKSGDERWVDVTASPTEFEGKPALLETAFDVTERKRVEALLAAEKRVLEMVASGASLHEILDALVRSVEEQSDEMLCSILLLDQNGINLRHGAAPSLPGSFTEAIDGIAIGPCVGSCGTAAYRKEPVIVSDIAEDPLWADYRDLALSHGLGACWSTPILSSRGDVLGTFAMYYREPRSPDQRHLELIERATQIAGIAIARARAEETIKHMAYHDSLTDLPNRTLFQDRLTVALAQARRKRRMAAVMFLDLDQFKVVNDTVGHALGDRLLKSVAERLTGLVREGDTVARVGGDEFTLLLPEVERAEEVAEVAERVLDALRQPWVLNGHEFRITASIGIAMFPNDGEDADSLLRNADTAMYRAKDQGKDNYKLYTPAMNARIAERLALENSLRHGLERGEFLVYYQPQVDIASGKIVGMEALVRWQHPERGLVFPAEFITVAEETGLIVPLGTWVLRTACAQNKAWQVAGYPPMRVAVNLSARQFQQRDLIEVVDEVLKETGLEARWLQLEITEGVAMQDVESNIAVLRELIEMGVQIAIDDFGTGHSSLSYLSRLPIDVIKIDRSFVQDMTTDPNGAAIAGSIIVMAHNLKLKVIAEGVETEEQLAFLKKRRCDEMQGYLFSKPAPAETFEEMLKQSGRTPRARKPIEASR